MLQLPKVWILPTLPSLFLHPWGKHVTTSVSLGLAFSCQVSAACTDTLPSTELKPPHGD